MVDKDFLQEVRDRLTLSSFLGRYLELKRAGRNYKAKCPFHSEKTPSFMISDDKQIFHCFGCGAGGDVFSFVMRHDGLSFPEAVELCARYAGLEVPRGLDLGADKRKEGYLQVTLEAAQFYHQVLFSKHGEVARNYLRSRGVNQESTLGHMLGFAPEGGDLLVRRLREKGLSLDLALELGLVKRGKGKFYDFFKGRLMFPIFDTRGRPIGFSGREIGGGGPKYVNSPESAIFHKSNAVYGLDKAGPNIRRVDEVLIVEGQLDVISLRQAGISNVVAPLGTALTAGHIHILSRYTKNMTLVFDGDDAGRKAAWRVFPMFVEEGLMPRAASMPDGEDPDSFVRGKGGSAFVKMVEKAPLLLEAVLDMALAKKSDNEAKLKLLRQVQPIVMRVKDAAERNLYMKIVGERLDLPLSSIIDIVPAPARGDLLQISVESPERLLAKVVVKNPDIYDKISSELSELEIEDEWARSLLEVVAKAFADGVKKSAHLLEITDDDELKREISAISLSWALEADPIAVALDCIKSIKRRALEREIGAIDKSLKKNSQSDETLKLLKRRNELERQRRQLMIAVKQGLG